MTVIADWPHLPKQSEVQDRINDTRNGYVGFALCTPTSIMPAGEMVPTLTLAVGSGAASEAMVSLLVIIAWCWSIDDA